MVTTANATLFFKMRGNCRSDEAQKGDFIKWVAAVCNAQTPNRIAASGSGSAANASCAAADDWRPPD